MKRYNVLLSILLSITTVLLIISIFLFNARFVKKVLFKNNIVDYISPICKGDTLSRLEKPINLDTFFTIIDYENVEYPVNATIYCDTCIKVIFSSLVGGKKNCINYEFLP